MKAIAEFFEIGVLRVLRVTEPRFHVRWEPNIDDCGKDASEKIEGTNVAVEKGIQLARMNSSK